MLCQLMHWHQQAPEYHISCLQLYLYLDRPCTFYLCTKRISFLYDTIVSTGPYIYKKMSAHLVFHLVLLFAPISFFPVYTSPNVLFSMYDMFTSFSFIVQTLRICCDAGECIFSVVHPSYETGVITLSLCVIVL